MRYHHVDVFSDRPYSGNSLAVFPDAGGLTTAQMARITAELRHFESAFVVRDGAAWSVRVFDLVEELDFAGHPVIGAAAVLHAVHGTVASFGDKSGGADSHTWTLRLPARTVEVTTRACGPGRYAGVLDVGPASFAGRPDATGAAAWFSLTPADLDPDLPAEVVSAGLRYLVLPVTGDALARARIVTDLAAPLAAVGADFAYLLDAAGMEGRHWNNDGVVEDVATGSGAACVAAYLRRHDRVGDGERVVLNQGRFTGRPSRITIAANGDGADIRSVTVGGDVALVAEGALRELPR